MVRQFVRVLLLILALTAVVAPAANATVSVSRAEVSGTELRLEGQALANRAITVDGVSMGTSDGAGSFRVERDPYTRPADCTVDVNDGSATATNARLAGCTVQSAPPPPPPPPSGDNPAPTAPGNLVATVVGTTVSLSWGLSADNTAVSGYRVTRNGSVLGTTGDTTFTDAGLAAGTYSYTVVAFDGAGNSSAASNSVTATVASPARLSFITPSKLPDATVGQTYLAYIVADDPPGPSTFDFKLVSGKVPSGTRFFGNSLNSRPEARVFGTPSTAGTFSFTVEVRDNTGATARRAFSVTVLPQ